jgi:uncharacterized protein (TIGR02145 family)
MNSVKIGHQEWSSENLNIDHFNNGDEIQQVESAEDWLKCLENKTPAWCYFDNNPDNGNKYGKLYNAFAVMDVRGIAPEGWYVPTDEEWSELFEFLGDSSVAGKLLKSSSGWLPRRVSSLNPNSQREDGNGTNCYSFNALPGGHRCPVSAQFKYLGEYGHWWSTSERIRKNERVFGKEVWVYYMGNVIEKVNRTSKGLLYGFSIRCVKN